MEKTKNQRGSLSDNSSGSRASLSTTSIQSNVSSVTSNKSKSSGTKSDKSSNKKSPRKPSKDIVSPRDNSDTQSNNSRSDRHKLPPPSVKTPYEKQPCGSDDEVKEVRSEDGVKKKRTRKKKGEADHVSNLVGKKLELYLNNERRENRFNTQGAHTTTKRMQAYDMEMKVRESVELERAIHRSRQSGHKRDKGAISPMLNLNSRCVVTPRESKRLTGYATKVFESTPVDKLAVVHRYRPHSHNVTSSTDTGKVQNYTRHVGAALHTDNYIGFYKKHGLDSGNPETSDRLKKLPKQREKSSSSSRPVSRTEQQSRHEQPRLGSSSSTRSSASHRSLSKSNSRDDAPTPSSQRLRYHSKSSSADGGHSEGQSPTPKEDADANRPATPWNDDDDTTPRAEPAADAKGTQHLQEGGEDDDKYSEGQNHHKESDEDDEEEENEYDVEDNASQGQTAADTESKQGLKDGAQRREDEYEEEEEEEEGEEEEEEEEQQEQREGEVDGSNQPHNVNGNDSSVETDSDQGEAGVKSNSRSESRLSHSSHRADDGDDQQHGDDDFEERPKRPEITHDARSTHSIDSRTSRAESKKSASINGIQNNQVSDNDADTLHKESKSNVDNISTSDASESGSRSRATSNGSLNKIKPNGSNFGSNAYVSMEHLVEK